MTTRKDLIQLAEQHAFPGTREILTAINEASTQLQFATTKLSNLAEMTKRLSDENPYAVVDSFAPLASQYDVAAGKLNTLFLTLACVLESNGVKTEY